MIHIQITSTAVQKGNSLNIDILGKYDKIGFHITGGEREFLHMKQRR